MAGESKTTQDHDAIRQWVESRGGVPATVKSTESGGEAGILRIDFKDDGKEGSLEQISWDEFFEKFDKNDLEFLYQETTKDGSESRFFKFVSAGK